MRPKTHDHSRQRLEDAIREGEARIAAFHDDSGTAERLKGLSNAEARRFIEWLNEIPKPGPLVEAELCNLMDRGDDELSEAILERLDLKEDGNVSLHERAIAALDSPSLGLRCSAIMTLGLCRHLSLPVRDKIASFAASPDDRVRLTVAHTVAHRVPSVGLALLDDPEGEVRYAAAANLARVEKYAERAEAAAQRLVEDRTAKPVVRRSAAEIFRSEDRIRAAFELLAGEGLCEWPKRGQRLFSGIRPYRDEVT
jgi:hypothetical protein